MIAQAPFYSLFSTDSYTNLIKIRSLLFQIGILTIWYAQLRGVFNKIQANIIALSAFNLIFLADSYIYWFIIQS